MLTSGWRTALAVMSCGFVLLISAEPLSAAQIDDQAGFFSAPVKQQAEERLAKLKGQGLDVRLESFASLPADKAARVKDLDRAARERFFADWARERARALRAGGAYILMCREPAHLRVGAAGSLQRRGFSQSDQQQISGVMLAAFREKQYDRGLTEAVAQFEKLAPRLLSSAAEAPPARQAAPRPGGGFGIPSWLIWVGLAVIVMMVISSLGRGMSGAPGMGGGGFMGSLLTGMFGAMAGHWIYDSFFSSNAHAGDSPHDSGDSAGHAAGGDDWNDFSSSGGDFGGDGGDFGGGGDF